MQTKVPAKTRTQTKKSDSVETSNNQESSKEKEEQNEDPAAPRRRNTRRENQGTRIEIIRAMKIREEGRQYAGNHH